MPGSTLSSLKRAVRELAPHKWTDDKELHPFVPGPASPPVRDVYEDRSKVLAREQLTKKAQEFSHKPFISSFNSRPEKGNHGGLEGTFSKNHGGFPYMSQPPEPPRALSADHPHNAPNMLTRPSNTLGPGYLSRGFSQDPPYIAPCDFAQQEKQNQAIKWGIGSIFRGETEKGLKNFATGPVRRPPPAELAPYDAPRGSPHRSNALKSAILDARPLHNGPFSNGSVVRHGVAGSIHPLDLFNKTKYIPQSSMPPTSFEKRQAKKSREEGLRLPPFRATTISTSLATPSVMFRK